MTTEAKAEEVQRSLRQNRSLHKWETMLAERLNDAGIPLANVVIKLPARFTKENIHELIFKPAMNALYPEITSTADPKFTTKMIQEVYRVVDQIIAERSGVHVEWPSLESQSQEHLRETG